MKKGKKGTFNGRYIPKDFIDSVEEKANRLSFSSGGSGGKSNNIIKTLIEALKKQTRMIKAIVNYANLGHMHEQNLIEDVQKLTANSENLAIKATELEDSIKKLQAQVYKQSLLKLIIKDLQD